jgi:hypothetical protein
MDTLELRWKRFICPEVRLYNRIYAELKQAAAAVSNSNHNGGDDKAVFLPDEKAILEKAKIKYLIVRKRKKFTLEECIRILWTIPTLNPNTFISSDSSSGKNHDDDNDDENDNGDDVVNGGNHNVKDASIKEKIDKYVAMMAQKVSKVHTQKISDSSSTSNENDEDGSEDGSEDDGQHNGNHENIAAAPGMQKSTDAFVKEENGGTRRLRSIGIK